MKEYYKNLNLDIQNFEFRQTTTENITKLLEEINPNKAVGIDNLSGRFLKDGGSIGISNDSVMQSINKSI